MNPRFVTRSAFALVGLTALITSAVAFQTGGNQPNAAAPAAVNSTAYSGSTPSPAAYTHFIGTFVVNTGTDRALIRSKPIPGNDSIKFYQMPLTHVGGISIISETSCPDHDSGHLYKVTGAVAPGMPDQFLISDYFDGWGHRIWSHRTTTNTWRLIGSFQRTPLGP